MTSSSIEISVVLCTHNRASSLAKTLAGFSQLAVPPELTWELIVVDNNSKDGSSSVIESFAQTANIPLRHVFEPRQGKSVALNTGVVNAKGQIIAFTDDDVMLDQGWLTALKSAFDQFDCIGIGGRVLPLWDDPKPEWLEMEEQQAIVHFDLGSDCKQTEIPPLGANMAFRREAFSKYGFFCADLGLTGDDKDRGVTCEDTEFGSRLLKAGEKMVYAPSAVIYHPVEPHRLTKNYLLNWYYNDGRSTLRAFGWGENPVCYLGIPRWLYRGLGINFIRWIFSVDPKARFHHKLRTYRAAGRIIEARRQASARRVPRAPGLSQSTLG